MSLDIGAVLAGLRSEMQISQRKAAADLGISQALLSHYENGLREPRLEFIVRACSYYNVSADYLFGRTSAKDNPLASDEPEAGRLSLWENEEMRASVSSISALLSHLCSAHGLQAAECAASHLSLSVYKLAKLSGCTPRSAHTHDCCSVQLCDAMQKLEECSLVKHASQNTVKELPPLPDEFCEFLEHMDNILAEKGGSI